jgi:hypothetical protein
MYRLHNHTYTAPASLRNHQDEIRIRLRVIKHGQRIIVKLLYERDGVALAFIDVLSHSVLLIARNTPLSSSLYVHFALAARKSSNPKFISVVLGAKSFMGMFVCSSS